MRWFPLLLVSSLLLSACGRSTEAVVAEVEGRKLYLRQLIPERGADSASLTRPMLQGRLLRWVDREALYHEALRRGIDEDPKVAALVEDATRKILVDHLRMSLQDSVDDPTEAEIADYYRLHKQEFVRTSNLYRLAYVSRNNPKEEALVRELVETVGYVQALASIDSAASVALESADSTSLGNWIAGDTCFAKDLPDIPVGASTPVRQCAGMPTFAVVLERRDSGDILLLQEVLPQIKEKVHEAAIEFLLDSVLEDAKSRVVIATDLKPLQQYPDTLEKR